MINKGGLLLITKIVGIVITAWILFLISIELSRDLKEGIGGLFNNFFTNHSYPYKDPNVLIMLYLVGYAVVWWKKLWGTVIIAIASIFGIIFSEAGDIQFHFMLTFVVGFLYFLNWIFERKNKMTPNTNV